MDWSLDNAAADDSGWAVCLSNGQELVRYSGWFSRHLAVRYLESYVRQMSA